MAIRQTIVCDGCGAPRQETNHWLAAVVGESFVLHRMDALPKGQARKALHFCGQSCVSKAVNAWMERQSQKEGEMAR